MRIIMPTFERIEWMPPTISLIESLADMGHTVVYVTIYPDHFFEDHPSRDKIKNVSLWGCDLTMQDRIRYIRGVSGVLFRLDKAVKRLVSIRLKKVINNLMTEDALLWVVNEMTVMLAGTSFLRGKNYAFTVYELHERSWKCRGIMKAAKNARVVVVPEYNRAHIMKSRYELKQLPLVMPNKTNIHLEESLPEAALKAIELLQTRRNEGFRTVLYMGGIGPERPLEPILDAIGKSDKYRLVVMGRESPYLWSLQKQYPEQFDYLGGFRPPIHIQVAQYAQIGLLMYVGLNQMQGLNVLFCAPNKLYEYTGRGLPVIVNDIPGLRFPVEMNAIGCVADFEDSQSVLAALDTIERRYEEYSGNAKVFFAREDVDQVTRKVLQRLSGH